MKWKALNKCWFMKKKQKRAFIYVTSVTRAEKVLLTQSVWKRKIQYSRPTLEFLEAICNFGHQLISNPNKHWSSFETTNQ